MDEALLSVGLDVGTTTTQLIVSALKVENRASGFQVPRLDITSREILYESPVYFTPLQENGLVDAQQLRQILDQEYRNAGIDRSRVQTGAVIVTGETSRKENARQVLHALSDMAGEFVVATAGPHLESLLAARGSGAVDYSEKTGKTVLHMDIGGGTSNLALIEKGVVVRTGCLDVGGRLIKLREDGTVYYVSPVLQGITELAPGDRPNMEQLQQLARLLCSVLEMASGRIAPTKLLQKLSTKELNQTWLPPKEPVTVSFSGGVADCILQKVPPLKFGDLGPVLGQAIVESSLCRGAYVLPEQTLRATVIGAGCHSTQLSGSTVFCRDVQLPKKNLPVVTFSSQEQESPDLSRIIGEKLQQQEAPESVLAFPGTDSPDYGWVRQLAQAIARGTQGKGVYVCLQGDMAKALGQCLSLLLPKGTPLICLDGLRFSPESFLDVGRPVGPCYPVVIKTLVLSKH